MGEVLTVNGGSHSLHLIMVGADGTVGARLDQSDPPGSATGMRAVDEFVAAHEVCAGLGLLGVRRPVEGNLEHDGPVSPGDAPVPVLAIEPREELQIARTVGQRSVNRPGVGER